MAQKELQLGAPASFVWCGNSLYNCNGNDVDACVLQMLDKAVSVEKITDMLNNLQDNNEVSREKHAELTRLVLARSGAHFDMDPMFPEANQQSILQHEDVDAVPREDGRRLEAMLEKKQMVGH